MVTRSRTAVILFASLVPAVAWVADVPVVPAAVPRRPNVLIIVADDQRSTQTLSVMPKTRRLIFDRGTRFSRAFATTPVCCPSRASILTGRYAHNHGVKTNSDGRRIEVSSMLQSRLRALGYRTSMYGKFLNSWGPRPDPANFDEWASFSIKGRGAYFGGDWNINGDIRTVATYSTDFISERAVGFIRSAEGRDARPWFMYVAPAAPHAPSIPEPRYRT